MATGTLAISPQSAVFWVAQGQIGPRPARNLDIPSGIPFTVSNIGNDPVPQVLLNVDNDEFDIVTHNCGAGLGVDSSCTVWVAFAPSHAGQQKATLRAAPDDTGNGAAFAELIGNGMISTGGLLIEPAMHDYGTTSANGGTFVFVVRNISQGDFATVMLSIPSPQNESPSDFIIVDQAGCAQGLAAGSSCGVQVNFVPFGTNTKTQRQSVLNGHAQFATGAPAGDANAALFGTLGSPTNF
jgi:hypothetical protein